MPACVWVCARFHACYLMQTAHHCFLISASLVCRLSLAVCMHPSGTYLTYAECMQLLHMPAVRVHCIMTSCIGSCQVHWAASCFTDLETALLAVSLCSFFYLFGHDTCELVALCACFDCSIHLNSPPDTKATSLGAWTVGSQRDQDTRTMTRRSDVLSSPSQAMAGQSCGTGPYARV